MKILAFDQATTKTGYACFEGGGQLTYGLVDLTKTMKQVDAEIKAGQWY